MLSCRPHAHYGYLVPPNIHRATTSMASHRRSTSPVTMLDVVHAATGGRPADPLAPAPIVAPLPPVPPGQGHAVEAAALGPLPYVVPSGHGHDSLALHHHDHGHNHQRLSFRPSRSASARFAPYQLATNNGLHHAPFELDNALPHGHSHHHPRHPNAPSGSSVASLAAQHHRTDEYYLNPHFYAYGAPGGPIGLPYPPIDSTLPPYTASSAINGYPFDPVAYSMHYPPTAAPSAASFSTNESAVDDYNAPFHAAQSPLNPPALRSNPLAAFLDPLPQRHPRPSYTGDFPAVERPPTPPHFKSTRQHRARPRPTTANNGAEGPDTSVAVGPGLETGSSTTSAASSRESRESNRVANGHDRHRRHSYPTAADNPTPSTYSAPGADHTSATGNATDRRYARHHPGTSAPATTANGGNAPPIALLSITCPQLTYITNVHGDVISIEGNGSVWDAYVENGIVHPFMDVSPLACYPLILGRNLFDFIVCGKMQALLKHMLVISSNAQRSRLNYHWYSETDMVERKLRVTLTRLSALMPNAPVSSTIRFAAYTASSSTSAAAAPPLPVVFSWTVTILSERIKSPNERVYASHLMSPPLPVATPHSRAMCLLCKRIQVDRRDLSQDAWLDFAGPKRVVTDTNPVYESDGYTPILGHRGRAGMQIASAVQTGLTVWLTGAQVAAFNASNSPPESIDEPEDDGSAGSVSAAATVGTAETAPSTASAKGTRPFQPQVPLCVVPVHVGVCEVCRLDVLQFFSPMYTPIAGPIEATGA